MGQFWFSGMEGFWEGCASAAASSEVSAIWALGLIVNPKKLETGLRTISAGIPYTLLLRIEAIGFPTFGLLL